MCLRNTDDLFEDAHIFDRNGGWVWMAKRIFEVVKGDMIKSDFHKSKTLY